MLCDHPTGAVKIGWNHNRVLIWRASQPPPTARSNEKRPPEGGLVEERRWVSCYSDASMFLTLTRSPEVRSTTLASIQAGV